MMRKPTPSHFKPKLFGVSLLTLWVLGNLVYNFSQFEFSAGEDHLYADEKIPAGSYLIEGSNDVPPAKIRLGDLDNSHPGPTHPGDPQHPYPTPPAIANAQLMRQSREEADAKSHGCVVCHKNAHDPHKQPGKPLAIQLGCTDCHGGDPCATTIEQAHVPSRYPTIWNSSANPVRSYTLLNHESPEFIQFVNPGDLRVAHLSCGTVGCHPNETLQVKKGMMTHGCMLWGAALYNNGSVPKKWPMYGESYSMHGAPQRLQTVPPPTAEETARKGVLPYLDPLPRYQASQPGNILRIFERGGRFRTEPGIPEVLEEPGRPRERISNRGLGTLNRTDPVFIGLQKTRLFDPTLNFLGTNDHPGDYRSSGCTSCHMIYANDRSPIHSGPYAKYGNRGYAAEKPDDLIESVDPMIPKFQSGHPVSHNFTRSIPTSQCIVCHIHPGTTVMNSYLGYMWWDMETDGENMYPREQHDPTAEQIVQAEMADPNSASVKGLWSNPEFLTELTSLNKHLEKTQFADFHGHGWVFRAVYKKDRQGNLLDKFGNRLEHVENEKLQQAMAIPLYVKELERKKPTLSLAEVEKAEQQLLDLQKGVPVHMLDVHLEKGMHCVDCHFVQDVHGDTKLYGEVRAAIEIQCIDCHGTVNDKAFKLINNRWQMRTSGPAAKEREAPQPNGRELSAMTTPFGKQRFELRGDKLYQNSMVEKGLSWEVTQVSDTIDPKHPKYNANAALAKTIRFDELGKFEWGDLPQDPLKLAHCNQTMSCSSCHSSWNPSCYGCHLPQEANRKMPDLHNEGDVTKNYVSYDFQTLRDDVFMLAHDGNVTGNKINPSRSSCAIHVTSYNNNRESIYTQQQTISAEGLSGIAFSTNVPHTVRGRGETKMCTDCHLSQANDNNAIMSQLLMQGTNYLNFIGRFCWVGCGDHGFYAVPVTERDAPQAVIGSHLHELAFREHYEEHEENDHILEHAHEHPGRDISEVFRPFKQPTVLTLQKRGEYLYAACGKAGVRVFDIAFIDHKGFSERVTTAPVSPIGQKFFVRTKYATSVYAPATIAPDPTRKHYPENDEQKVPAHYGYLFATDLYEGLVFIGAGTLLDGDPLNNFLEKELAFNPGGALDGAQSVKIVGNYAYVCCEKGLVVVDVTDPKKPCIVNVLGKEFLNHPHQMEVEFRYGFVCDEEGLKVIDITDPSCPIPVTALEFEDLHNVYVARNYAYLAAGKQGLIIVDVTNPEKPLVDQIFNAEGEICDLHDVKLGITYNSEFAYLADGKNGMHVLQLTSPHVEGNDGFSVRPEPKLIATYHLHEGEALCIAEGIDRDRAVDESGNQIAVFGRVGARPFNYQQQRKLYINPVSQEPFRVETFSPDYRIEFPNLREDLLHQQIESYYGSARQFRE
ncbi:hypothetical protein [Rubinisphaera sp.]|uniref:hypothetical protein n=1 Tax=Rubinisphaera sp. TaxID=2024857 RepID=UPI0025F74668|nr:hypothetical protein [Rubinisphaera sp.]